MMDDGGQVLVAPMCRAKALRISETALFRRSAPAVGIQVGEQRRPAAMHVRRVGEDRLRQHTFIFAPVQSLPRLEERFLLVTQELCPGHPRSCGRSWDR